jgi:hypothetical protein
MRGNKNGEVKCKVCRRWYKPSEKFNGYMVVRRCPDCVPVNSKRLKGD